jgi:hexulose-6-phosphate isomerase
MVRLGIMQGRLGRRPPDRLQVFPSDWRRELEVAASLGFEFLEWLLLPTADGENPLDSATGRREVRRRSEQAGLPIGSVCAARFMDEPLAGLPVAVAAAAEVGAARVLVPLLERARIDTPEREGQVLAVLAACLGECDRAGVTLALELDLPGDACARLVRRCDHPRVRACYDAGNSTALGLDIAADVEPVLPLLAEVHVKDRYVGGPSVPVGSGDAGFAGFFAALRRGGYAGDVVLEHFFESDPVGEAARARDFVRRHLESAAS